MVNLTWNSNDFEDEQDNSGVPDGIDSNGKLKQGYQHGSVTRGLVAYYPMEKGNGEVLLDGAQGHHAQINGATWSSNSKVGENCLSFNGTDNKADFGPLSHLSNGYTVTFWMNGENFGDGDNDDALSLTSNNAIIFREYGDNSFNLIQIRSSDGGTSEVSYSVSSNTWYFVTGVWDGSQIRLYINGDKKGSKSADSLDQVGRKQNSIGAAYTGTNYFDGKIDDVRIYNRVLSEPEIQALYNSGNGIQNGIKQTEQTIPNQNNSGISRYKLSGDVTDSWSSNDGTDNTSTGYETGVYGQAKKFNGTDDYISIDKSLAGTKSEYSVFSWFKTTDSGNYTRIYSEGYSGSNVPFIGIQKNSSDQLEIQIKSADTSELMISSSSTVNNGNWHHGGFQLLSDGTVRLYLDGKLINTGTLPSGTYTDLNQTAIGTLYRDDRVNYWNGQIDDLRIYSNALTPVQIEKLYNKGAYRISRGDTLQ